MEIKQACIPYITGCMLRYWFFSLSSCTYRALDPMVSMYRRALFISQHSSCPWLCLWKTRGSDTVYDQRLLQTQAALVSGVMRGVQEYSNGSLTVRILLWIALKIAGVCMCVWVELWY